MKIVNLLEQHRKFSTAPGALIDNLGDGFLIKTNSLYGRLRVEAQKLGFQFSTRQNDAYRALPLSQLDTILKQKIVPYIDNVSVLEEIEKRIPKQSVWNDIADNLKGNSVFHESCHLAARSFGKDLDRSLANGSTLSTADAKVLVILLEESFANACELLSILDAEDQVHRIFLELNSYVYMLDDRVHLANAKRDLGAASLLKFILLCYLHANFLREIGDRDFDRILALASASGLDAKQKKALRQLSKIAFKLNPRFREVTTRFYLRLNLLPHENALKFDFLKALESTAEARTYLEAASAVFS